MSNWFGGEKKKGNPIVSLFEPEKKPAAAAAAPKADLAPKEVTQTVFGGRSKKGGAGQALGQSQYADLARKTLLGQ